MKEIETIEKEAKANKIPIMMEDGIAFLCTFIQSQSHIQSILEVGSAVGYSAICMAKVRWDIHIDTLEIDQPRYLKAISNIQAMGLADRICVYGLDALLFYPRHPYDLFFIDAAKSQYGRYLEHFYRYGRKGSFFIFDNMNFHGIVDDEGRSHNRSTIQMVHKIQRFKTRIMRDKRFKVYWYGEVGDGILVLEMLEDPK